MGIYPKIVFISISLFILFGKHYLISSPSYSTQVSSENKYLAQKMPIKINSSFEIKEASESETIPYDKEYRDDKEKEYGLEEIIQQGVEGLKTYIYKVSLWHNEEIGKDLVDTKIQPAVPEIISVGKKVVWREIDTEYGNLKYWRKIHVFATKYDGNCEGCRGLTYSGTLVRKGVCAVDPKVIPLGTNFYVEGYGMCRSEDIGGLIKGKRVDLGYEDVTKGEWRTGYTDVYLLTSYPTD